MKNEFKLAGHTFTLKNVKTCDFMSEETVCYEANLYCDGKLLARVYNEGHGGPTNSNITAKDPDWARKVEADVHKEVWITCQTGDIIYHDLGTVADEVQYQMDRNKEVSRLQKNKLVLDKADGSGWQFYTLKLSVEVATAVELAPKKLAEQIAKLQSQGWSVVNTNIPQEIYDLANQCVSGK